MRAHMRSSKLWSTARPVGSAMPTIPHISLVPESCCYRVDALTELFASGVDRSRGRPPLSDPYFFKHCLSLFSDLGLSPHLQTDADKDKEESIKLRAMTVSRPCVRLVQRVSEHQPHYEKTDSETFAQPVLDDKPVPFNHHRKQRPPNY